MNIIIDIALVAIIAFCVWRGYKSGLIRSVFGVVMLIVAIIGANLVATAYSDEFTGMLNPFVGGVVDTALADMLEESVAASTASGTAYPAMQVVEEGAHGTAIAAFRRIGLLGAAAENVAERTTEGGFTGFLSDVMTDRLSSSLAFIVVFAIAFILIAIIFSVIGNLLNFTFSLPGLRLLDRISGAVLGLAKGLLITFTIAVIVRYIGLFAPEIVEETFLLNYMINENPIARALGV
ncbi:MAG: CvpA family protein [Oscillospiraceae bacterium]|nr:CvpA family protein [Oscillospiraceae bacterium]